MKFTRLVSLLLLFAVRLPAQKADAGAVSGTVLEQASGHPIQYVAVQLMPAEGGKAARSGATDPHGAFAFEAIPFGAYKLGYGAIGFDRHETPVFTVDAAHRSLDLGRLMIAESAVQMEKFGVTTRKEAFYNSIDRKVYNVGQDIQSTTGSAGDLLQNVPSVDVDIEGNVSLRGNDNVLILVNGKPSTLMNTANRGMALEQDRKSVV